MRKTLGLLLNGSFLFTVYRFCVADCLNVSLMQPLDAHMRKRPIQQRAICAFLLRVRINYLLKPLD